MCYCLELGLNFDFAESTCILLLSFLFGFHLTIV